MTPPTIQPTLVHIKIISMSLSMIQQRRSRGRKMKVRSLLKSASIPIAHGRPGSLSYHGPTSIYNGALASSFGENIQITSTVPSPLIHSLDSGEGKTNQCIGLFFHWQYSQFMFIDREAFVQDYQRRSFDSQFCSSALIKAVCSIGALMSPDPDLRKRASYYSQQAIDMVMNHGLVTPHTTSVQTLLCCAFFEIGAGNLSKAWLLSGEYPK